MAMRILVLLLFLLGVVTLSLCLGEVNISPVQLFGQIFGTTATESLNGSQDALAEILWQIRLPRILVGLLVGAALAVSGYLMQSLSNNPLADPYLTGVSAGAALAVATGLFLGIGPALNPSLALIGGALASGVVLALSRSAGGFSIGKLLLGGVAVSSICSAVVTLILTCTEAGQKTQSLLFWLAGSVSLRSWSDLQQLLLYFIFGVMLALFLSKPLRLLSLGFDSAAALGLPVKSFQLAILFTAVLLCGAAVSVSGVVGFVGLIAPYCAREIFGTDERVHIVCCAMIGALLVALSDLAARTLAGAQELPLGTLLSLVGGPFFIYLIMQRDFLRG